MNATAERPEWLPYVQQCDAQGGLTADLPSLEAEFGRGNWKVLHGGVTKSGTVKCILYWYAGPHWTTRVNIRIGGFVLPAD